MAPPSVQLPTVRLPVEAFTLLLLETLPPGMQVMPVGEPVTTTSKNALTWLRAAYCVAVGLPSPSISMKGMKVLAKEVILAAATSTPEGCSRSTSEIASPGAMAGGELVVGAAFSATVGTLYTACARTAKLQACTLTATSPV